jgi:hypothetical protein
MARLAALFQIVPYAHRRNTGVAGKRACATDRGAAARHRAAEQNLQARDADVCYRLKRSK